MRARTLNFLFVTLVMAIIALTLGSALLLRAAVCMGIMLALSFISAILCRATATLKMNSGAFTTRRGQRASAEMELSFVSILPMGSLAFALDGGRLLRFGALPFMSYKRRITIDAPHVGVFPYGSGTLYMTDVFNLFVFSKRLVFDKAYFTVLPVSFPADKPENHSGEEGEGEVRFSDDADEPSGIREWVQGDLLKRVHWKLSCKTYDPVEQNLKLIVKTYEEATRPDILILPDLCLFDAPDETNALLHDGILEGAYSLCHAVINGGDTVRLVLCGNNNQELVGASEENMGEIALALARAEFDSITSFDRLVSEAMRRVGTTSTVVFVTARLDERSAELLLRLKSFSGMTVAVMYVTDSLTNLNSLQQARLEAAGICVTRHQRRVREAIS